jgi:hypothetical protein
VSTLAPRIEFDAAGLLQLQRADGGRATVCMAGEAMGIHPVLSGRYAVAGGFVAPPLGAAQGARVGVDLIDLLAPGVSHRCTVQPDGNCTDLVEHELGLDSPGAGSYVVNPRLAEVLRGNLNDFQIYTVLSRLVGPEAGTRYLDSFAADHLAAGASDCQLVVLFNHHYARNCRAIHDFYVQRFPCIDFVLPCAAPRRPHYYAYPFGSYQFHGLVHGYLSDQLRLGGSPPHAYLFIQDDVLLHPRLSAASMRALLSQDCAGMFPFKMPYALEERAWAWSARIRNTFLQQRDNLTGNGFEGLHPALSTRQLHHGVSDCFALRADIVPEFLERLAPMLAANLFPEVAIPTALYSATRRANLTVAVQPGRLLWGASRAKVRDPDYIRDFLASEAAFLHPLKVAQMDAQTLHLIHSTGLQESAGTSLP